MKSLIWCAFVVIAILVTPTLAFGDILTDGDTWPRTTGPGISVDGDWTWAGAHAHAEGEDYWGYGGFEAWNFTYTTESGNFEWGYDFVAGAIAEIVSQNDINVAASANAWGNVYGPASRPDPDPYPNYIDANADLAFGGYAEDLPGWYSSPAQGPDWIDAMDGVYCVCFAWADASIPEDGSDIADAIAAASSSAWISE